MQLNECVAIDKCVDVIGEYAENVFGTDEFLQLSAAALQRIVGSDQLDMSEIKVFEHCIKWADAQLRKQARDVTGGTVRHVLGDVLKCIRFPLMSLKCFSSAMSAQPVLTQGEELSVYRVIAKRDANPSLASLDAGIEFSSRPRNAKAANWTLTQLNNFAVYEEARATMTSSYSFVLPAGASKLTGFLLQVPQGDGWESAHYTVQLNTGQRRQPGFYTALIKRNDHNYETCCVNGVFQVKFTNVPVKLAPLQQRKNVIDVRMRINYKQKNDECRAPETSSVIASTAEKYTFTDGNAHFDVNKLSKGVGQISWSMDYATVHDGNDFQDWDDGDATLTRRRRDAFYEPPRAVRAPGASGDGFFRVSDDSWDDFVDIGPFSGSVCSDSTCRLGENSPALRHTDGDSLHSCRNVSTDDAFRSKRSASKSSKNSRVQFRNEETATTRQQSQSIGHWQPSCNDRHFHPVLLVGVKLTTK